ncbi:MAG: IS110 family transposase [Acidobacteria bacterium]|nr:IS110 family transposase [Acidobacteriota bacterium]
MTATHEVQSSTSGARLHLAFELSWNEWQLAFTIGHGQPARLRSIAARDLPGLLQEIAKAKRRFGLADDAAVVSCYEAGRDGFWLHRWLTSQGVANVIVDSASIEVNRRKRRAKSDHLDAAKLVSMLLRYHAGETKVWSVVRVPSVADEDHRHLHRELIAVQDERTEHTNRIKAFLAGQGIALAVVTAKFPEELAQLRCGDGSELGVDLRQRLLREFARWQLADRHVKELEHERKQRIRADDTPHVDQVRGLLDLAGIGLSGSWLLVYELLAWRKFSNRRQVGAIVGLTPTPYQSGDSSREQGISKAGSKVLRRMMVELAWGWLRWQPDSELSRWYARRFADHGKRARKVGIVALARKLLIALWRYVEQGEVPAGARRASWRAKVKAKASAAGQGTAA